jgi:hypothetical protein
LEDTPEVTPEDTPEYTPEDILEDTLEETPGDSLQDTPGGHLGGHPWRQPMEDTPGGNPWRTPLEDTPGGHAWRTPREDINILKMVVSPCHVFCSVVVGISHCTELGLEQLGWIQIFAIENVL